MARQYGYKNANDSRRFVILPRIDEETCQLLGWSVDVWTRRANGNHEYLLVPEDDFYRTRREAKAELMAGADDMKPSGPLRSIQPKRSWLEGWE